MTADPQTPPAPASRAGAAGPGRFPVLGGASLVPAQPGLPKQLAYRGLDLLNRLVPKDPDAVVLHSTIDLEDGVLAVLEGLAARGRSATVLLEQPARAARLRRLSPVPVRTVPKKSARALLRYLRARTVMTTENVFGNRVPPASQLLVNIWHGEPPTKVTGRFFAGQGPLAASVAPVCSTVGRAYRSAEFGLDPRRVPVVGAPRNDRMLRGDRAAARRALLGEEAGLPTLLWLPSFRSASWGEGRVRVDSAGERHPGVPFPMTEVLRLDRHLAQRGARVVVKLHPHDVASFTGEFRAIRVLAQEAVQDAGLTLYPALPAFDGLITDMSSIWVDYLLLDRPVVFAFPDVEDYRDGRGLNLEPYEDWVPGPFARTVDELIGAVDDLLDGRDPYAEERGRARRRFHQHLDDRSTERLLDGLGLAPR